MLAALEVLSSRRCSVTIQKTPASAPGFGSTLRGAAELALSALLAAGCTAGVVGPEDREGADSPDRAIADLASVPQLPSASVCNGRWHCYALVRTTDSGTNKMLATP